MFKYQYYKLELYDIHGLTGAVDGTRLMCVRSIFPLLVKNLIVSLNGLLIVFDLLQLGLGGLNECGRIIS